MPDFVNTMPVIPHRFDEETVRRFREHEGDDRAIEPDQMLPITGARPLVYMLIASAVVGCSAILVFVR